MKIGKPFSLENPNKSFIYKIKNKHIKEELEKLTKLGYVWSNDVKLLEYMDILDYPVIFLFYNIHYHPKKKFTWSVNDSNNPKFKRINY